MSLLTKKVYFAFAEEAAKGTVETISSSHIIKAVGDEIPVEGIVPLLFPDQTVDRNLGDLPQFAPGLASWDMPLCTVAAAGHVASDGTTITKLPYGRLIEACGFEALDGDSGTNEVLEITVPASGWTGAILFRHGEVVNGNVSGESGVVIGDTWQGTTTLYIENTGTTWSSTGPITGASSGASCNYTAISARFPHAYRMLSDPDAPNTLTGAMYYDGKLLRAKGCRGNMVIRLDHANRAFFDFQFKGILHNNGNPTYWATDVAFPSAVSYFDRTAAASLGLNMTLNNGTLSYLPVFNRLSVDIGNQVVLRENTNSSDGWDVAKITGRQPRFTCNPEEALEANYTFIDDMIRGITARGRFTIGATDGNKFTFIFPFLSIDSLGGASRDSVREWDGTFRATKGSYVSALGATAFGANNEVVIIHH